LIRDLFCDEEWDCVEPFVFQRGARRDLHEHFAKLVIVLPEARRWTLSGLWEFVLETNDGGVSATFTREGPGSPKPA
jgi:hypothetical protein